jgi:Tfp pilus assembly protein PilX
MKTLARHPRSRPASGQRGIVLIFALIVLVIMMIGAVAITRSISGSQLTVGNLGFKRDLANQGEQALQKAMDAVRDSGALASPDVRTNDLKAANYKATMLPTNPQGVPLALLSKSAFDAVGVASNDIAVGDGSGVTIRYVIDRMATTTGICGPSTCMMANQTVFGGGSSEWINSGTNSGNASDPQPSAVPQQAVYRLTVRVNGPRGTQSFFQSTFTVE